MQGLTGVDEQGLRTEFELEIVELKKYGLETVSFIILIRIYLFKERAIRFII